MIRGLSGWVVLLVLAIGLVIGLFVVKQEKPPRPDDPLAQAQEDLLTNFGFSVERQLSRAGGLTITKVNAGSPADQLGLRTGDVVLAVNERSMWHAQQLFDTMSQHLQRNNPVQLLVKNNGIFRPVMFGMRRRGPGGPSGGPGAGKGPAGAPGGMPPRAPMAPPGR